MSKVTIDNVTKEFGDDGDAIVAVDDVSLEIKDGEFVVFVGPSGSGKSTLLRMVAGLERQTDGDVVIGDYIANELDPRERNIAMVFQNYALYPNMTVRENMSFGLKMSTDMADEEIDKRVEDAATTMGIGDLLDNRPGQLSGGQQQRVALGRAIVRDPAVFLMDEPLSNLDAKLRTQMRTEINRLQDELGVTTLYVTHDQTEAMTMGDRLVVLNQGELQQVGTPLECFYRPENRFVAGFIGSPSMNFFEGSLTGGTLQGEGFSYDLSERMQSSVNSRQEATLGIRPEDLVLHDEEPPTNDFEAVVDVVEPMGSISYIYLQPTSERTEAATFIAEVDGSRQISEGDTVYVDIPPENAHLFDPETGETIHQRKRVGDEADATAARQESAQSD